MDWIDELNAREMPKENHSFDKTDDWYLNRLGKVTGSNFSKFIVKDRKGGYTLSGGKVAENLIYKIAWERLLTSGQISSGLGRLNVHSKEMEHGNTYEAMALEVFEQRTGLKVEYNYKFVELDEYIGGTPDGYVGNNAIIEVKCPWNGGNHLRSLLTKEIYNEDYIYQIQGYLWMTGRDLCYFVTYDPDLEEGLDLSIIEVKRDESIIEGLHMVMDMVKHKIKEIINSKKLKNENTI